MTSRVRELADFLREDPSIVCGMELDDHQAEDDPYIEAARRILFQVHLIELPTPQRQQASTARRASARGSAVQRANAAGS